MFIVCPSTLLNSTALETRTLPKRMIGRIAIVPRRDAGAATLARLIFEMQVLRYLGALAPLVVAMLVWPHLALPISQAPIPMLLLIYFVETRVLSMPKHKRALLLSDAEADRVMDALRFNAERLLRQIAARKGIRDGRLHLVVEQSELARVPVLTLVSVQAETPGPQVLDLDETERALVRGGLFDATVTEQTLHNLTLREGRNLHSITIEAGEVSAHARMAALMERRDGAAAQPEPAE
jgi:hypothetical protein